MNPSRSPPDDSRGLTPTPGRLRDVLAPRRLQLLLGLCLVAILVLALLPTSTPMPHTGWDKGDHVLAFACLAGIGSGAFPGRLRWLGAGLLAYGGLIEVLQSLTPYRYANPMDLVGNAIGIAIGLAVAVAVARRLHHSQAGSPPPPAARALNPRHSTMPMPDPSRFASRQEPLDR